MTVSSTTYSAAARRRWREDSLTDHGRRGQSHSQPQSKCVSVSQSQPLPTDVSGCTASRCVVTRKRVASMHQAPYHACKDYLRNQQRLDVFCSDAMTSRPSSRWLPRLLRCTESYRSIPLFRPTRLYSGSLSRRRLTINCTNRHTSARVSHPRSLRTCEQLRSISLSNQAVSSEPSPAPPQHVRPQHSNTGRHHRLDSSSEQV